MANSYYSYADKIVYDGNVAQAADLNTVNLDADSAFELVEADILALEALVLAGGVSSLTVNAPILDSGTSSDPVLSLDVDDVPVNGDTATPISSNWAYDHANGADPHSVYKLESELGTAAVRDAEDTLTNGSNLPDGAAITAYVAATSEPADATILKEADVDDTPVDSATTAPISSNWAYDHAAANTAALALKVSKDSDTGAASIPSGTTAQQPGTPAAGMFRFNSDDSSFEGYDGSAWGAIGGGTGLTEGTGNGVNKITNGDFASDTIWTKGTGWAIGSGVATKTAGSASNLDHTFAPVASTDYKVTFEITAYTAGSFTPQIGGVDGTARSATGTYSETITTTGTGVLKIVADATAAGSIDNVIVQKVSDLDAVTAVAGEWYPIDTSIPSNTVTVTLPASPSDTDRVGIKDVANTFDQWECTVDPGSNEIEDTGSNDINLTTSGQYIEFLYSEEAAKWLVVNSTPLGERDIYNKPFMHVEEQQTLNTAGSTSTAGDNDRVLNTSLHNDISGASLGSNLITLPAGTYYIEADAQVYTTVNFQKGRAYIKNSSGDILLSGIAEGNNSGTSSKNHIINPTVSGKITLGSSTQIKLTVYHSQAVASGCGYPLNQGDYETYASVRIWKLDTEIKSLTVADPDMYLKKPLMHVQDQKTSGTDAGNSSTGANQRTLNTTVVNEISGASLSSSAVTLPAGTYWIEASAPFNGTNTGDNADYNAKLEVLDSSDNVLLTGNSMAGVGKLMATETKVHGRLTLGSTTTIKLNQYWTTGLTDGLGEAVGKSGSSEIYSEMRIWQEDAVVQAPITHQPVNQAVTGAYVTGGIYGGELVYNSTTTFDVNPVSCMSDDLSTAIAITSSTTGIAPGTTINEIYHVFAVRYNTATYGIETDTDIDGAALPGTVTAKRWLGFVTTDSSGDIIKFIMSGDTIGITGTDKMTLTGAGASSGVDAGIYVPIARVESLQLVIDAPAASIAYVYSGSNGQVSARGRTAYSGTSMEVVPESDGSIYATASEVVEIVSVRLKR